MQPTSRRCVRSERSGAVFARKEVIDIDESGWVLPLVLVVLVAVFWDGDELLGVDGSYMSVKYSFHFHLEALLGIRRIEQDSFGLDELVLSTAFGENLEPERLAELGIEVADKDIGANLEEILRECTAKVLCGIGQDKDGHSL